MSPLVNPTVSGLLFYIHDQEGDCEITAHGYAKRPCYMNAPQYCCPVLDAIEAKPLVKDHVDIRFENLAKALLQNKGLMIMYFELTDKKSTAENLIEQYPIKGTHFNYCKKDKEEGQGSSRPIEIDLKSSDDHSIIRSMTFSAYMPQEWEKSNNRFQISFKFDHWVTAVKMNLLMCNLFNLSFDKNYHCSKKLTITAPDEEQFMDMLEFVSQPHTFDEQTFKPFRSLLIEVLLGSKNNKYVSIGEQLLRN